jgi:hypothetical protein
MLLIPKFLNPSIPKLLCVSIRNRKTLNAEAGTGKLLYNNLPYSNMLAFNSPQKTLHPLKAKF